MVNINRAWLSNGAVIGAGGPREKLQQFLKGKCFTRSPWVRGCWGIVLGFRVWIGSS